MKNEMPFHTDKTSTIPYTYKSLPKNIMVESHKADNKYLNNHLSEIEEAVDKKLMDKNSFVHQQIKYHGKSGILNHDNFFHCDLATGTPISSDNFKHFSFLINPYMVIAGIPAGDDLEVFSSGGTYPNRAGNQLSLARSDGTNGTIDDAYNQIAVDAINSTGNINLGAYDDDGSDPDNLYADTGGAGLENGYVFVPLSEFQLTTSKTWLAFVKSAASQLKECTGCLASQEGLNGSFTYGSLPDPMSATVTSSGTETCRLKLGHT